MNHTTKLTYAYLRKLIKEEVEATTATSPTGDTKQGSDFSANVEQMTPEAARTLADEAFDLITTGQIGKARSNITSLQRTAAGRIALAVQALLRFGNASAEEINSYSDVIRKIAASADAPPE
jgi:hypothetical protein